MLVLDSSRFARVARTIKLKHWIKDYIHALNRHKDSFLYRNPPEHYLGFIKTNLPSIIIIPGVLEKWHFLKSIADPLSIKGYAIYVMENGYNTQSIKSSAKLIGRLISQEKLKNVIIIAHSKGGLIGKQVLLNDKHKRVKKLIAIATPFEGSKIVKLLPHKVFKELSPESKQIFELKKARAINKKITSIYGKFDNHVWPETSSVLEGAENIQINAYGHHKILANKKLLQIIQSAL